MSQWIVCVEGDGALCGTVSVFDDNVIAAMHWSPTSGRASTDRRASRWELQGGYVVRVRPLIFAIGSGWIAHVDQPLFELVAGGGILSALGSFFGWNARTTHALRAASPAPLDAMGYDAVNAYATRPRAGAALAADQPLALLTARFHPFGALRECNDG